MLTNPQNEQSGGIQLFTSPTFGTIRTAGTADNPLFCLTDVCRALGLTARDVAQRLGNRVISNSLFSDIMGRPRSLRFINEDDLYDAIFDSRKPDARQFHKLVTSEILPAIRKKDYDRGDEDAKSFIYTGVVQRHIKSEIARCKFNIKVWQDNLAKYEHFLAPTKPERENLDGKTI